MSKQLQPVRGTHDLMGEEMRLHHFIKETARAATGLYGFEEVATPIFEFTEVFHRTLGDTSDVVTKETYTFDDRGGESITLRPELTASVVRAFLSAGLTQNLPFKAFYSGPAFRYERPQKGRLRQFHQIGVEMIGADSPWHDVEMLACAMQVLTSLGLDKHVTLEVNSLGDVPSRLAYREVLLEYLRDHASDLSEESRVRMEKNPLRVLDSKQEEDKKIVANAPALHDAFNDVSKDWFETVKLGLDSLKISYMVSPRLVRGLDYYTHSVFECTCSALGSQNTVLAGGRYDGLVAQMGGPEIAGIGWAAGMERLALVMQSLQVGNLPNVAMPVVVIPMGDAEIPVAMSVSQQLRADGVYVEQLLKGNVGKRMKKADKMQANHVIMIGSDEVSSGVVMVKNLVTGEQRQIAMDTLSKAMLA
jgi:histidyl-tRNA synthetase